MAEGSTEDLPSLQEPQLRPVDITPSGGWDNFYHWLCCVCVVTFDLELGQALETVMPADYALSDSEKANICYLAFPDSNSGCMGDTQYHFRIRSSGTGMGGTGVRHSRDHYGAPAVLLPDSGHYYGFVYFRQAKDADIKRGYFQKSVVLVSRLPYINLFTYLVQKIAPEYFSSGLPSLEAACYNINQWPHPHPGDTLQLPLLGFIVQLRVPMKADKPTQVKTGYEVSVKSPTLVSIPSIHDLELYMALQPILDKFELIWELVLTNQPIVVMATSPTVCSNMVQALVSLIHPLTYAADYRPFFTIHDTEFKNYTTRTQTPPQVILGVTNPFFAKALDHWPHIIKAGDHTSSIANGAEEYRGASRGRSLEGDLKPEALRENERLRTELDSLRNELDDREKLLLQAGEMGKKVLEMNQELHNKMEDMTREFTEQLTQKVEALVQEKHVLQQKAESQRAVIQSLQHDLEGSRRRHEQERVEELKRAEELHAKQVHRLTNLSNDLKGEVEKLEMKVKMYEEKLHKQEVKLGRLSEELANKCNTTCLVTELQDMEQLLARQRARSEELEGRLMEVCGEEEVLKVEVGSLNLKVRALEEECEERNGQASAWYQSLQEVKDQNVVLSKELEMMQLQSEDDTHQKKGNSLFGEVEDRRREIELQMMTLQVKYDTMDKTHTFTKQQLKKLKSEMSALLCRHGATTADVDHMHRLQRQVEQLKSENQQLEAKVSKLSKLKGVDDSIQHSQKYLTAFVDFGDKEQHMKILQQELEREKSAKSSVCKELELKRLQLVWEGNKLGDAEYKLHQSEQEQVVLKKELTRARLQLQEVTEKLNDATSTSKKLECQNKLLEEELTAKGKRKTVTCKPSDNPSFQESVRGQERKGDENSVEECGKAQQPVEVKGVGPAEVKGVWPAVPSAEARRRVSILEDLEKELNKEKGGPLAQQQHGLYPLATNKRPFLPTERSTLQSKPAVLPTVVTVQSRVNRTQQDVNQCPQQ